MMKYINILLVLLLLINSQIFAQKQNTDSLLNVIDNSTDTTKLYAIKSYLGVSFYTNPQKCKEYQPIALEIALKHNDKHSVAFVYNNMGITYAIESELDSAEKYFKLAVDTEKQTKDQKNLDNYLPNYAYVFKIKGNYDEAIKIYFEALKIAEKQKDDKAIGLGYYNIADLHFLKKDYENSLHYFQQAKTAYEKTDKKVKVGEIYSAFGSIYEVIDSLDKALEMYKKAEIIYEQENATFQKPLLYHNIAYVYLRMKNYDQVIPNAKKSIELFDAINSKDAKLDPLLDLVEAYLGLNDLNEAKTYFKQASEMFKNNNNLDLKRKYYDSAIKLAESQEDYKNAYNYSVLLASTKDTLFNIEQERTILELTTKYETEKKERENLQLKTENLEVQKRNRTILFISFSIFVILVLIFILYRSIQQKKHRRALLEKENIEKQRIARELHDNQCSELATVIRKLKNEKNETDIEIETLNQVYNQLRMLSHEMDVPSFVDINFDEKLGELVKNKKDILNIQFNLVTNKSVNWSVIDHDKLREIYRIIQEALNNIAKHAHANKVDISFTMH